ncbi:MAG: amidohydrolase family protein [Acidobacteriales bacterium]|nr:amidohydrolase family protein [Terriglobales bacterium]
MTLLPGLIDAHVHLAWDKSFYTIRSAEEFQARSRARNCERQVLRIAHHAQLALAAGVTTVRDCGADDFSVVAVRDAVNSGQFVGPRILVSGRPITTTGGHLYCGWSADDADEVRSSVRVLAAQKVDFVKLVGSGGTNPPGTDITRAQYTLEEMSAAVQEAHSLGLQVAVHAVSTDSICLAAEAGVDTIEHCSWIGGKGGGVQTDEAAVDLMVERGVGVDHAIVPRPCLFADETRMQTAEDRWWLTMLDVRWPFLRHMRDRGVAVFLGTDAIFGPWPGTECWPGFQDLARAIEVMVQWAGFSPLGAISMATCEAARALGLNHEIGTIEAGKQADLILVRQDPLRAPSALREVEMVLRGGELVAMNGRIVLSRSRGAGEMRL